MSQWLKDFLQFGLSQLCLDAWPRKRWKYRWAIYEHLRCYIWLTRCYKKFIWYTNVNLNHCIRVYFFDGFSIRNANQEFLTVIRTKILTSCLDLSKRPRWTRENCNHLKRTLSYDGHIMTSDHKRSYQRLMW